MKLRCKLFFSSDAGIIYSLFLTTVLLAIGGVKLGQKIAANMLRTDAQSTTLSCLDTLMQRADLPSLLAGLPASPETLRLLENATRVSDIYRFRIWTPSGQLVYSSERLSSGLSPSALEEFHRNIPSSTVLAGHPVTHVYEGKPPQDKLYFGVSYLPVVQDGRVIGVFQAYLDQTADRQLYEHSFFLTESIIALGVILASGFPAFLVYRKMGAHRLAQAEAMYLADHDSLTGIANRKRLEEVAQQSLSLAKRMKSCFAVLLIDLDRFKEVNDTYGHGIGDELLKAFAHRLGSAVRADDSVGRLGGDEFVILQLGTGQPCSAKSFARRLLDLLAAPYHIGDLQLNCSASIGVAIAPFDANDWDALLSCADVALYKAKAEGRNTVCFFEPSIDAVFRERRQVESELRRAHETEQFQLAYQPLFRFEDGTLLGFEALLRWPLGWESRSPMDFIPVAEESGLIIPIGAWVLKTACKEAAGWNKPLKVAVNLSPVQFRHGDIVATVQEALTASGLDPCRLELEVTESLWIQNTDAVLDQLGRLRAMGISIALDDFGTGYSSLTYLWKFPFDVVKIDRTFVMEIETDPKAGAIVNTIVALGKSLEVTVTAEGVETAEQARALSEAGCHQAQGYLFGRPLTPASASQLVDADLPGMPTLHPELAPSASHS